MARFKYVLTDKYGKQKRGVVESPSQEQAVAKLTAEGGVVMEIHESASIDDAKWNVTIGNPVKKKDITIKCGKQSYCIWMCPCTDTGRICQ